MSSPLNEQVLNLLEKSLDERDNITGNNVISINMSHYNKY